MDRLDEERVAQRRLDILLARVARMARWKVPDEDDAQMPVALWAGSGDESRRLTASILGTRAESVPEGGADWWRVRNAAECVRFPWKQSGQFWTGELFRLDLASEPVPSDELPQWFASRVQLQMRRLEGHLRDRAVSTLGVERKWAMWASSVATTVEGDVFSSQRARASMMSGGFWNDEDTVRRAWSWTGCPVMLDVQAPVCSLPVMQPLGDGVLVGTGGSREPTSFVYGSIGEKVRAAALAEAGLVCLRDVGQGPDGRMVAISRRGVLRGLREACGTRRASQFRELAPQTGLIEAQHVFGSCDAGPAFEEDALLVERHVRKRSGMPFRRVGSSGVSVRM